MRQTTNKIILQGTEYIACIFALGALGLSLVALQQMSMLLLLCSIISFLCNLLCLAIIAVCNRNITIDHLKRENKQWQEEAIEAAKEQERYREEVKYIVQAAYKVTQSNTAKSVRPSHN